MGHLKDNNENYISHFLFASRVGLTLILRGWLFVFHAILPIGDLPRRWNLYDTITKLKTWNEYTEKRKK